MTFDPIAYLNEPRWRSVRPGLDRIRELLDRLGRPQDELRFVHVAGTNGKGSVCAYIASVLTHAEYRTGLFTSPYIERFEERIRVDGHTVSMPDLLQATLAVRAVAEAMEDHPTEFELMCAVALVHFASVRCDIVVLEVGLGGRFDATNVIDAPEVSVITRIGLDHTDILGTTLSEVAFEKAGIIKSGVPVVSWPQEPAAALRIAEVAAERGSSVRQPDFGELAIEPIVWSARPDARSFGEAERHPAALRWFSYGSHGRLKTGLIAHYQPFNASLALETIAVLRERGWRISDDAVRAGVADARWIGRFEVVSGRPLCIVDGGHNPQGARALAESLREAFPHERPVFLIGVLADKDYASMLKEIVPLASGFVAVEPDNPRALPARALARAIAQAVQDAAPRLPRVQIVVSGSVADAVSHAKEMAGAEGVVCAFGSLYSVAAVRRALL